MTVHLEDRPPTHDKHHTGPGETHWSPNEEVTAPVSVLTLDTDTDTATAPVRVREPLPCHTVDPDLWFAESPADVESAKALCLPCPRKAACLAGALERREPWGVWGGQLVLSGVVVPRKRPRGRPRKEDRERDLQAEQLTERLTDQDAAA